MPLAALLSPLGAPLTLEGQGACPPSCANNEMVQLLDKYCSDKGTFWQSKHHYGSAYHSVWGSIRNSVRSILEVGIGEDTAPSARTWTEYFPNAQIYLVDIKTTREVTERAKPGGHTDGVAKHQAKFGCEYNRSMWKDPRVHLFLDTDASDPAQLEKLGPKLPAELDIIIDDGSHRYLDQEKTLHTLWSRLRPGGFYVVEDVLVGALPWDASHASQVPTINDNCGLECFFPQRLAEHPFMHDRFNHLKDYEKNSMGSTGKVRGKLTERSMKLFYHHDWFWAVTGVHKGGGLDTTLLIRKKGDAIGLAQATPPQPAAAMAAAASGGSDGGEALKRAQRSLATAEGQMGELKARQAQLTEALQRAEALRRGVEASGGVGGSSLPWLLLLISLGLHGYQHTRRRGGGGGGSRR